MNFEKFLEPPQKYATASCWLATMAFTLSTCQMWCSVHDAIRRFTSFRVALISQFIVTVNGMIAEPAAILCRPKFGRRRKLFQSDNF